jgi:RimJ/RimL family protein N-acetyltransferase
MTTTIEVPAEPALVLRPWQDDDADALIEIYQDPAIQRWVRPPIRNLAEAKAWLAIQKEGWRTGNRLCFAVRDETQLLACVVLKRARAIPEVGYWTAAPARGQGIASTAVDALSAWAFATHNPDKLELRHQVDNTASCRVAEKAGFSFHTRIPAAPPDPLDGHLHVRHGPPVVAAPRS